VRERSRIKGFFLIEFSTFVIFLRVKIDGESFLGPCLHLRSFWGYKCNSLEYIRGDLGERLSW